MYASLAITSLMWSLDLSQRGDSLTMSAATSYLIRYSLEPLAPARSSISLSESLSPSRRRWPRPSCDCLYASRLVEDLLDRLQVVRVSGSLSRPRPSPQHRPRIYTLSLARPSEDCPRRVVAAVRETSKTTWGHWDDVEHESTGNG